MFVEAEDRVFHFPCDEKVVMKGAKFQASMTYNNKPLLRKRSGYSVTVSPETEGEYVCTLTHSRGSRIILASYKITSVNFNDHNFPKYYVREKFK